jgi:hypothetical protein
MRAIPSVFPTGRISKNSEVWRLRETSEATPQLRAARRGCLVCPAKGTIALSLSCFTIQAAKSFLPDHAFSTFSVEKLNLLAESPIGGRPEFTKRDAAYSATTMGLLRSAVANFLFNYKMAQQFPQELSPCGIAHSALEFAESRRDGAPSDRPPNRRSPDGRRQPNCDAFRCETTEY